MCLRKKRTCPPKDSRILLRPARSLREEEEAGKALMPWEMFDRLRDHSCGERRVYANGGATSIRGKFCSTPFASEHGVVRGQWPHCQGRSRSWCLDLEI